MTTNDAIVLSDCGPSAQGGNVVRLLRFFGVPWRALTRAEFLALDGPDPQSSRKSRLFCSADVFLKLLEQLEQGADGFRLWQERVHSALVYAGDDLQRFQKVVQTLSGDDDAVISKICSGIHDITVSDHFDDFCGVMAGIRVTRSKANTDGHFVLSTGKGNLTNIVSCGDGAIISKVEYKGVPVFLSTCRDIIDIDAELKSQNFDVREHFLGAVPLVLYIKWAFAETCWNAPEMNACLIIDDPVLKPTHGFVNFHKLLLLMKRHKFSTNIAFIPWNWRRSAPGVVRLFKENPERYSLSVHGCDHTRAEFGSSSQQRLYWKLQQAAERMNRHRSITGIHHDPVMVFPQGVFSEAAMSALKRTNLIASVNNDIISADPHPRAITISDVWDIAVMRYSFPLFTRRYPWEGIENFAFDALLGKPAIAIIHHDYCSDGCERLVSFIQRVNALRSAPTWRTLGDVVRRSCRQRANSTGAVEVEMYGTELCVENRSGQPKRFLIRRREFEPSAIQRISTGAQEIDWRQVDGRISFEIDLNPNENRVIKIKFYDFVGKERNRDNLRYRFNTMLRRYLCEVRDNYVAPLRCRFAGWR